MMLLDWRALLLASLLIGPLLAGCEKKMHWREEVALGDGRTLLVRRNAWLGDDFLNLQANWPHYYAIEFENPQTSERISWSGKYGIAPVMLEVGRQGTYLVISPFLCNADLSDYNNPNPPFVYLRYAGKLRGWKAVSRTELPEINRANLTPGGEYVPDGEYIQNPHVIKTIAAQEQLTAGYFQADIPATLEAWRYKYKKPGPYEKCF